MDKNEIREELSKMVELGDRNVLISIKPKYVKHIINGSKKFEYRKKIFKQSVSKVIIYSSSPDKSIIGYFDYQGYIEGYPKEVWIQTYKNSGITEQEYFEYAVSENMYAIKIINFKIFFSPIKPYDLFTNFKAPQSFMYI